MICFVMTRKEFMSHSDHVVLMLQINLTPVRRTMEAAQTRATSYTHTTSAHALKATH